MTEKRSSAKVGCMTCLNRSRNANDDDFCLIIHDFLDVFEVDFISKVGCASHSDLVDSVEKCPDRAVDSIGIADCNNHSNEGLPYICSAKRHHEQCPRGFKEDGSR